MSGEYFFFSAVSLFSRQVFFICTFRIDIQTASVSQRGILHLYASQTHRPEESTDARRCCQQRAQIDSWTSSSSIPPCSGLQLPPWRTWTIYDTTHGTLWIYVDRLVQNLYIWTSEEWMCSTKPNVALLERQLWSLEVEVSWFQMFCCSRTKRKLRNNWDHLYAIWRCSIRLPWTGQDKSVLLTYVVFFFTKSFLDNEILFWEFLGRLVTLNLNIPLPATFTLSHGNGCKQIAQLYNHTFLKSRQPNTCFPAAIVQHILG